MSDEEKIRARIEAAFNKESYTPDSNGNQTVEVDIPSADLDLDDIKEHELIEDAFEKDSRRYTVYVSAESNTRVFTT